jgi:hypothetical protein
MSVYLAVLACVLGLVLTALWIAVVAMPAVRRLRDVRRHERLVNTLSALDQRR